MWFDNLYLYGDNGADKHVIHFDLDQDSQRVWWTNIVSEGSGGNSTGIAATGTRSQYYVGGAFLAECTL